MIFQNGATPANQENIDLTQAEAIAGVSSQSHSFNDELIMTCATGWK